MISKAVLIAFTGKQASVTHGKWLLADPKMQVQFSPLCIYKKW